MNLDDLRAAILKSSPEDRHEAIVGLGKYSVLDLFDHLPWLKGAADWSAWRTFLGATYGLPLSEQETGILRSATALEAAPTKQAREVWMVCGRRARKSAIASVLGAYVAAYKDHRGYLAPGERATIPILARTKTDARQIRDYVNAIFTSSPELSHLLEGEPTAEDIRLKTRCDFAIRSATITSVRSRTVPLFIGDEIAFWRTDDSANPDREIISSVLPAQALVPDALIVGLSSPYARRGILWDKYQKHYGKSGDILVWKAPTVFMHDTPEIRAVVEKAYLDDPFSASAEYGAEFREDVAQLVSEENFLNCLSGETERPYERGVKYSAFVDPAGGSSDSFTVAIAHFDGGAVLDKLVEWEAPFDPGQVVVEATAIIRDYNCTRVTGDGYAGKTFEHLFRKLGINYHVTPMKRSDLYRRLVPLINGGMCTFIDVPKLKDQLLSLDRKVTSQGREIIDHPRDGHDDVINAAAGALVVVDMLRHPSSILPTPTSSTQEIYLNNIWGSIKRGRGEEKRVWVNPYAQRGR